MYQLEIWRCSGCSRILATSLTIGAGSVVRAHCWSVSCGVETTIDLSESGENTSEGIGKTTEKRGKSKETVGRDGEVP